MKGKKRIIVGVILFAASYIQLLMPRVENLLLSMFCTSFILGVALVFDGLTKILVNKSLIDTILANPKNFRSFVYTSVIAGVGLEIVANFLGKFWIYPYWNYAYYLVFLVTGFCIYWLMIVESYLAIKAILDLILKNKLKGKDFQWEPKFYKILGVLGFLALITSVILLVFDYSITGGVFVSASDMNKITENYVVPWGIIVMMMLSIWMIFEYFENKKHRGSLLRALFHRHPTPLLATIIGSFTFGIIMESQNIMHELWKYLNWPFPEFTIIGLPASIFAAWILHYIVFLSLFRVLSPVDSKEVWK